MNKQKLYLAILGMTMAGASAASDPLDGQLDTSWNTDGKLFANFDLGGAGQNRDVGTTTVVTPDGFMYIAGRVYDENDSAHIGIVKLDPLGIQVDEFSFDGEQISDAHDLFDSIKMALSPADGRLLITATRRVSDVDSDIIVCAFDAMTGTHLEFGDPNEPTDGCTTAALQIGVQRSIDIVVQPDGKFIVVGKHSFLNAPNERYVYATRFNVDGSTDDTFNSVPKRNSAAFIDHDARSAALASNGKIVIVGAGKQIGSAAYDGLIMRLNADGTVDETGPSGEQVFNLDGAADRNTVFNDVSLESAGTPSEDRIVVVGGSEIEPALTSALVARMTGGPGPIVLDTTFNNGIGFTAFGGAADVSLNAVAVHPCAGYITIADLQLQDQDSQDIQVVALSRNGGINTTFGEIGGVALDFFSTDQQDFGRDIAVAGNGVYVAGAAFTNLGDSDFVAAKLSMDSIFCNGLEN